MPTIDVRWWSHFRTIGSVSIVHVDLSPETEWEREALGWLDEQEKSRWQRYEYDGPRRRFALCRATLRAILCKELQCRNEQLGFRASQWGKPYALMNDRPVSASFSVSHSGNHGLVAHALTGRLGVDIEERDTGRDLSLLVDTVLGPEERAALALTHGHEQTRLFFKIWTLKEAVLKALGKGFSMDATCIEIPAAMLRGLKSGSLRLPSLPEVTWHIEDLGTQEVAAAVAFELNALSTSKDVSSR